MPEAAIGADPGVATVAVWKNKLYGLEIGRTSAQEKKRRRP
jgi:hypothetical protein